MEFDFVWLLLGLPVAFALGWLASRWDFHQLRLDNRQAPKAYFKGLNFLLTEQQDQAIDAFIEAVQSDPDTSELHFALGNLFRRRGEFHRAVRVHEHLLARGDLNAHEHARARYALAQDYLRAGLLDRAEDAFTHLQDTAFAADARLALLAIYERSRDWARAGACAAHIQQSGQGDFSARQAHYLCEEAEALLANAQEVPARHKLEQAAACAPHAPRPHLALAAWHQRIGQPQQALHHVTQLAEQAPAALPLAADLLLDIARAEPPLRPRIHKLLQTHYAHTPALDLLRALVALDALDAPPNADPAGPPPGSARLLAHLQREPSLVAAAQWLGSATLPASAQQNAAVQRALEHATQPLTRYRCAACGFEARRHFWHCPGCQSWDSYPAQRVEEL